jgi:hypothetical protein
MMEISKKEYAFWMRIRECLINALGAIEDYLGRDRSIVPRRKREYHKAKTEEVKE